MREKKAMNTTGIFSHHLAIVVVCLLWNSVNETYKWNRFKSFWWCNESPWRATATKKSLQQRVNWLLWFSSAGMLIDAVLFFPCVRLRRRFRLWLNGERIALQSISFMGVETTAKLTFAVLSFLVIFCRLPFDVASSEPLYCRRLYNISYLFSHHSFVIIFFRSTFISFAYSFALAFVLTQNRISNWKIHFIFGFRLLNKFSNSICQFYSR